MKINIKYLLIFTLFALFSFNACQDEEAEVNNPDEQEAIVPGSELTNLISGVTANFGATDDILDGSSCFSLELPVTIIVNDVTIIIETEDDLEQLEDLLEDLDDFTDVLDFVFPITIIYSDYSALVIENEDQLASLISDCDDEDDIIECVDFVYPISFSIFNSDFSLIDTVVIENDEALYDFLENLEYDENATIVSLNYPVTLEYANGETLEVNSNLELAEAIEAAEDDCDDDDNCEEDGLDELLTECLWEVNDELNDFEDFYFQFNEDGSLQLIVGATTQFIEGNWSLSPTDSGLILNITELTAYQDDLGGEWLIVDCDEDEIGIVNGDLSLELEQQCDNELDCSIANISGILQECPWDFSDGTGNFDNNQMIFHPDGNLQITEGDTTVAIGGLWNLSATDEGIVLTFSELTAFQDSLGGEWVIVDCDDDELELVRGNDTIELEQDCENDNNPFQCFNDFEIVECNQPNNVPVYNLSANTVGLVDCPHPFFPSFHATLSDAENNINAIENTENYATLSAQAYLRIEAENGDFEIFTIYLNTEDCDYFECFGNYDLAVCDEDDGIADGIGVFDLSLIFSNCPNDDVEYTFHNTLVDAENYTSPLPSLYTNTTNPQTIYSRVSLAGDPSIYEIFLHNLIVEDCNEECSEADVDAFLFECIWNIISYNGSDNLSEYNFDFESTNQIVVIYTNDITIDATWSTSQSDNGVIIEFSNVAGANIQAINGSWLVVECTPNQLVLHDVNTSDNEIVLQRACE